MFVFKFAESAEDSSNPETNMIYRRSLPLISETPVPLSETQATCTTPAHTETLPGIQPFKPSQVSSCIQSLESEEDWEEPR